MERHVVHTYVVITIFTSLITILTCKCNAATDNNNNVTCLTRDRRALRDFKSGLIDPDNSLSSWRGAACCRWMGVVCDNFTGAVTGIRLHGLRGEIGPSLVQLRSLKHLDLSYSEFEGVEIPGFLDSLENLEYLNLSNAGFGGTVPPGLGNLSRLQYLDVSNQGFPGVAVDNFRWVTGLVSLKYLGMDGVDLSSSLSSGLFRMLNLLPDLTDVHLLGCGLTGSISVLPDDHINFTSLAVIDLSFNSFDSIFPDWLANITSLVDIDLSNCMLRGRIPLGLSNIQGLLSLNLALNRNLSASIHTLLGGAWQSIEVLDLASNRIHGRLSKGIGNLTSLTDLNLFDNNITGGIPTTIGMLCKLVNLDISGNQMIEALPKELTEGEECGGDDTLPELETVRLSANMMTGSLPDWLGKLRNLKELSLDSNMFEGHLPDSLGSLGNLTNLSFANNRLNGTLPSGIGHLSKLDLELSFQFINPECKLPVESHIQSPEPQHGVVSVRSFIPRMASVSDWARIPRHIECKHLRLNTRLLQGRVSSFIRVKPQADVDLSSNLFEGTIPLLNVPIELLDLSNNKFHGQIPQNISTMMPDLIFLSLAGNQLTGEIPSGLGNMSYLSVIDLSGNHLTGSIPESLGNCFYLKVLDLGNNRLSGEVLSSIGQLNQLRSLHLNGNLISGNLPVSLQNLSRLETLDLERNKLGGALPEWLGEGFTALRIMNLRANAFSGEILLNFATLSALQVLDLAGNNLTGRIPTSIGDLKAMAKEERTVEHLLYGKYRGVYYEESLVVNWKNQSQKFTKMLSLVTAVDLSGNNLSGEIPVDITRLHGLMVLNLSRNHISGQIPETISMLRQLASLDLSNNDLSGPIPASMVSLTFLAYLNLSNNKLSGKIPYVGQMSTFDAEAFQGNPELCGTPLESCPSEDTGKENDVSSEHDNRLVDNWFYLSLGLGFTAGIFVPYLILAMKKPWSDKYSDFLDKCVANLFGSNR
ncbi:receptor-like protein EIX2 [Andrographis paniculata]|uniref:receptor-like protein EIX2 n=1 Tax=Andrographis paniculata TaxID=175694 RepID=UPI0021E76978|nr:receptor-like protein EIX2 [Andrographis paniculata]